MGSRVPVLKLYRIDQLKANKDRCWSNSSERWAKAIKEEPPLDISICGDNQDEQVGFEKPPDIAGISSVLGNHGLYEFGIKANTGLEIASVDKGEKSNAIKIKIKEELQSPLFAEDDEDRKDFISEQNVKVEVVTSCQEQKGGYKCEICGKSFSLIPSLEFHKRTNNCFSKLPLEESETSSNDDEDSNIMVEVIIKEEESDIPFIDVEDGRDYFQANTEEIGTYLCETCGKVFSHLPSLRFHQRSLLCEGLKVEILGNEELEIPIIKEEDDSCLSQVNVKKELDIPIVDLGDGDRKDFLLENHVKVEEMTSGQEQNGGYKCEYCGKSFSLIPSLEFHQRTDRCQSGNKKVVLAYNSNERNVPVVRHLSLKSHIVGICEYCGKTFSERDRLFTHKRTHTKKDSYICNQCGKSYTQPAYLRLHLRRHSGDKPFECADCGKLFTTKLELLVHTRTHTGVRPYVCKDCGKSYRHSGSLKTHTLRHTGVRPYVCRDCGKSYCHSGSLKTHFLRHTVVRPYVCKDCGKSYCHSGSLRRHISKHTGVRSYPCLQCGKPFSGPSDLKAHLQIHARNQPHNCDK